VGVILLWAAARSVPQRESLLRGWVGMVGLILLLHFGTFQIIALVWQRLGVKAAPIMSAPLRSTSLGEFWGKRWNLGFRQLAHELIFRPLNRTLGLGVAGFLVFVFSGLIHDLVISLPARAGYGLPTTYFVLQGSGMAIEHSRFGKRLGLGQGWRGWLFMAVFVAGPVFWLFHPWFVLRVILPFMQAIHAL
jgi:alginate O-acetyltransferase complex protein AlgI